MLSGTNAKLNLRGRYVRLPNYGEAGHKTLGNGFTTLLDNYGNPNRHYGDFDFGLARFKINQSNPVKQSLA